MPVLLYEATELSTIRLAVPPPPERANNPRPRLPETTLSDTVALTTEPAFSPSTTTPLLLLCDASIRVRVTLSLLPPVFKISMPYRPLSFISVSDTETNASLLENKTTPSWVRLRNTQFEIVSAKPLLKRNPVPPPKPIP